MTPQEHVEHKAHRAQQAATQLRTTSTAVKNAAILAIADALLTHQNKIYEANERDLAAGRERGLSEAMLDRLRLNEARVAAMAEGCRQVAALPDPVGTLIGGWTRPNGLNIAQVRVPLGVVGIIYESRPNVTVDAAILCLKAGNAVLLRGGSEAIHSNLILAEIIAEAVQSAAAPADSVQLIEVTDRAAAQHLMTLNGLIDVLIPRGGAGLIQTVVKTATVPVIETGAGNCHVFVDETAEVEMASNIVFNAKVSKPSVCNALDTLLVHQNIAAKFLPSVAERLRAAGVELRGDERARAAVPDMTPATEEEWDKEFLSLILAVRVVDDADAAINHIAQHGAGHSEAIVTQHFGNAEKFCARIDAAAVLVNTTTRFVDGFEFGLGAEIGISTQKLHARGPMGLEALTSTKFVVRGNGQVR
ncbi:MAG: glutamate-5-semialdehyde dehydrogenase [Abitibacteriaceae bacterium]|nr:glutamate-5-semialdehyde dehydrogenase [Abditibacteriaceae bacterium]